MKFQVLADDAAACNQLADNLRAALKNLKLDVPVEMDASPSLIANLNVGSPVLAEDHRVIASGKMLSTAEITELLTGLHGAEIDKLRIAAERSKKKAHLFKGILLLIAILCGVFAIVNEIRQRRAEAAAEADREDIADLEAFEAQIISRHPKPELKTKYNPPTGSGGQIW